MTRVKNAMVAAGLAVTGVCATGAVATAQDGDPEAGMALAEQMCAECHVVGPELYFKQEPPSFASIALYRTDRGIRNRIYSPHIGMPQLGPVLHSDRVDDIIAYIRSLDTEER